MADLPLKPRSAEHAVGLADRMLTIIMSKILGREPARIEPPPFICSEEPAAQGPIAAVKQIFEEMAATDLQDCLSQLGVGEDSRDPRQSSEANTNEDYGYILSEVNRKPGLEVQRDDEAAVFATDDEARLQFVTDLERGVIYAKAVARELLGRPRWSFDVDNETMFYCSKVLWALYGVDPDAFGGDDREARRVALIAAELFEQRHRDTDWDKADYTDEIWKYVETLERRLTEMECPCDIQNEQQLHDVLVFEPTLQRRAQYLLKRLDKQEDLTRVDDILGELTDVLREVAKDG